MTKQIKIALIDDEALILEGLSLLFAAHKKISVIIKACGGIEFLEKLMKTSSEKFPDIALIDIQMKPMNGFELVEKLKERHPELKIIILSTHYKNNIFGHMIKLGVSAFLPKTSNLEQLTEAIQSVYDSGIYFSKDDHQMLVKFMKDKPKLQFSSQSQLSAREIDVVKLICLENTNQEIADKLFLSKRTVESHRQRILEKIGAKNTVGIVLYAIANEIYNLPPQIDTV